MQTSDLPTCETLDWIRSWRTSHSRSSSGRCPRHTWGICTQELAEGQDLDRTMFRATCRLRDRRLRQRRAFPRHASSSGVLRLKCPRMNCPKSFSGKIRLSQQFPSKADSSEKSYYCHSVAWCNLWETLRRFLRHIRTGWWYLPHVGRTRWSGWRRFRCTTTETGGLCSKNWLLKMKKLHWNKIEMRTDSEIDSQISG